MADFKALKPEEVEDLKPEKIVVTPDLFVDTPVYVVYTSAAETKMTSSQSTSSSCKLSTSLSILPSSHVSEVPAIKKLV